MNFCVKNIIFDLGGVLLKWDPDAVIALTFPDQTVRDRVRRSIFSGDLWHRYDAGEFSEKEAIALFSDRASLPREDLVRFMNAVREFLVPIPESLALMRELRQAGKKLYCLSNVNEECYKYFSGKYSFTGEFDGTVISGRLGICKPDPGIFVHLMSEYGLEPGESIFIDDNPENVAAACRLGILGIRFVSAADCRAKISGITSRCCA